MLASMLNDAIPDHGIQVKGFPIPHAFPADCGFQAVAQTMSFLQADDPRTMEAPMTVRQACQWRALFHQSLTHQGIADVMIDSPLALGGAKELTVQLEQLLEQHGVAPDRVNSCAGQLIQSLGRVAIQQSLRTSKPWSDLKAKASNRQPPIRIVNAEELKRAIQQRMKQNKSLGSKANKQTHKQEQAPLSLQADQLVIPTGIFQQEDGVELEQIGAMQIGPGRGGIVLINRAEAEHLFS